MTCFDEEDNHDLEEWQKTGKCQHCGKSESEFPICDDCFEKREEKK